MDLVVDANILFAALIRNGPTLNLMLAKDMRLFVPEFIFEEFSRHRREILEKTLRSEGELDEILGLLRSMLIVVPKEELNPLLDSALKISPDPDDAPYLALAMLLGIPIWSNDKILKRQSAVQILSTEDLLGRGDISKSV